VSTSTDNTSDSNDTPTDFKDRLDARDAAERERELTDRSQPYMRHAHLFPPRSEFETLEWYVAVLKLFDRAPTTLPMYRFNPTLEQCRHNGEVLMRWEEQQRVSRAAARGNANMGRRLAGWLDNTFDNVVNDVASTTSGRNTRLRWAARRLAELGFDKADSKTALMDASAPWDYNEAGRRQSRATIESGWRKGIADPVDLSDIEAELEARDD
jgi:hypothetical protein